MISFHTVSLHVKTVFYDFSRLHFFSPMLNLRFTFEHVLGAFAACMCVWQEGNAAGAWDPYQVLLCLRSPVRNRV